MKADLVKALGGVGVVLAVAVTATAIQLGWWAVPAVLGLAAAAVGIHSLVTSIFCE